MTIRLRHIGCKSVAIVYHGEEPLARGLRLRSKDWAMPDGSRIAYGALLQCECPDCGTTLRIASTDIEPIPRQPQNDGASN